MDGTLNIADINRFSDVLPLMELFLYIADWLISGFFAQQHALAHVFLQRSGAVGLTRHDVAAYVAVNYARVTILTI